MAYRGPDRRIHKVFVTRNTEYHIRRSKCVAVRDRNSGRWLQGHFAVDRHISGALRFSDSGGITATPGLPRVGESMYFEAQGRDLVTSSVVGVERPHVDVIAAYPSGV